MRKLLAIFGIIGLSLMTLSVPAKNGYTGTIDFPTAYNLRTNNYSVSAIMDHIEEESSFGFMFEGGFIPQIEAGISLSTEEELVHKDLMKANFKFQFVQEANNPAMAIGFAESDEMFGYLVASKVFNTILDRKVNLGMSGGVKYSAEKETNYFGSITFPLFDKIILQSEFYSYDRIVINNEGEEEEDKEMSYNVGGEFYTNDAIRTKVFWREQDDSFGVTINYIGIYR